MKIAIKFAAVYFGISILVLIASYIVVPDAYPGDSFMIIWAYVINLLIGIILFPLLYTWLERINLRKRAGYLCAFFLLILFIINILPFFSEQVIYTFKLVEEMFKPSEMQTTAAIEFVNPIISFSITYLIFRKSILWRDNIF